MKSLCLLATVLMISTSAMAVDLNIKVTDSTGGNSITVSPGATVDYIVEGVLTSSSDNEGLALIGSDLVFDGGDLTQGDTPTVAPMDNFVRNLGISNPDGYGGTIIDGDIIQFGGGQNTINNTPGNAAFPIGTVITGVAHSDQEFLTGSLVAPATEGTYTLELQNVFANVIQQGQTGVPFWATEAATVGVVESLTIIVDGGGGTCNGNEKVSTKCKTKSGAVKKLIVKVSKGTPGAEYCGVLDSGPEVCKNAKNNGKAKLVFKGGNAPPCGAGMVTVCGSDTAFDCGC